MAKNSALIKKDSGIKSRWVGVKEYFSKVVNELKKVYWPNRQQLMGYTSIVILTVAIVSLIIWVFDSGLSFLLEKLFKAFA